jgi:hypothetical protein
MNDKEKRSERIHQKETKLQRKIRIAKEHGVNILGEPHRYSEMPIFNCGSSNCVMCGNPRKFWDEYTIQEKRFIQTEKFAFEPDADS